MKNFLDKQKSQSSVACMEASEMAAVELKYRGDI